MLVPLLVAGRPVFTDWSLEELASQASLVLIVERNESSDADGPLKWRFLVVEVLAMRGVTAPQLGQEIVVFESGYRLLQEVRRNVEAGGAGFSYAAKRTIVDGAPRWTNQLTELADKRLIIFVRKEASAGNSEQFEFEAQGAFAALSERERILKQLDSHTA